MRGAERAVAIRARLGHALEAMRLGIVGGPFAQPQGVGVARHLQDVALLDRLAQGNSGSGGRQRLQRGKGVRSGRRGRAGGQSQLAEAEARTLLTRDCTSCRRKRTEGTGCRRAELRKRIFAQAQVPDIKKRRIDERMREAIRGEHEALGLQLPRALHGE
jgi:hypothetical protein